MLAAATVWTIQWSDERNRRHTLTLGTNKREAEIVLGKKKTLVREGKHLDVAKKRHVKFEELAQEYLELCSPLKKAPKRDEIVFAHLNDFFKGRYIDEINRKDILSYQAKRLQDEGRKGKKVSKSTVGRELSVLKTAYKHAISMEYITAVENPMIDIPIAQSRKIVRYLTDEERLRLLSELSKNARPFFDFLLESGCRYSEASNLTWEKVDFDRQVCYLADAKTAEGEEQVVHLSVRAMEILRTQQKVSAWVFYNPGTKERWGSLHASFKRAAKRAGLVYANGEAFRIHDLRHDFCSRAATSGVDLRTIAELARHKDIRMTMRYAHLSADHIREAFKKMGGD